MQFNSDTIRLGVSDLTLETQSHEATPTYDVTSLWGKQLMPVITPTWEADRSWFKVSLAKGSQDPISTNKLGVVVHTCYPMYEGILNR
jgi:hypothetical protein